MDKVISLELAIKALTGWETDPTDEEIEYTLRKLATDKNVGTNDTINRQQAIDALKQQADTMSEWSERYAEQRKGVLTAVNIVEDLPSAQPKIIRCKDCNHFYKDNLNQWCFLGKYGVKEDDFCSRAERKTNEQFN